MMGVIDSFWHTWKGVGQCHDGGHSLLLACIEKVGQHYNRGYRLPLARMERGGSV